VSKPTISKLKKENSLLLMIDYQEKLFPLVFNYRTVQHKAEQMIKFAQLVKMPIVVTEQYPQGLGGTVQPLASLLQKSGNYNPYPKKYFNCFKDEKIKEIIKRSRKRNLIICGIETHICVLQTALSAVEEGFNSFLLVDAVSSRNKVDNEFGLMQAESAGVILTTVETVIYQMVEHSNFSHFKEVIKIVTSKMR